MKKNKKEEKAREHFLRSQKEKARMGVFSFLIAKEKRQTLLNQRLFYGATILSLIIIF
jgi:hypothetical protein